MDLNAQNQIFRSPKQLNIDRDPSWPSSTREVGDGMEAEKSLERRHAPLKDLRSQTSSPSHLKRQTSKSQAFSIQDFAHFKDKGIQTESANHIPSIAQCLLEEKVALKDHLQIQIQVNQELKRLLVASVGDDLSFHYERLATEKAQLTLELEAQQKKYDEKLEELEALEITCDVWRSKFLASRMQCEELLKWKRHQERSQQEMESAVRGLLREHWERSEHLEHMQRSLSNLAEVLRLPTTPKPPNSQAVAEKCRDIVDQLFRHFLGKPTKASPCKRKLMKACDTTASTPAEKYVLQLLSEQQRLSSSLNLPPSMHQPVPVPGHHGQSGTISRFHARAVFENVTLNCCHNCKGDIQVV